MAIPNIFFFSVLIFVLALFSINCVHGRRTAQQLRPTRGFKEMELAAARNFGKRAINMHVVNRDLWRNPEFLNSNLKYGNLKNILMEWIALENKMKGLRMQRDPPELSEEDILLESN